MEFVLWTEVLWHSVWPSSKWKPIITKENELRKEKEFFKICHVPLQLPYPTCKYSPILCDVMLCWCHVEDTYLQCLYVCVRHAHLEVLIHHVVGIPVPEFHWSVRVPGFIHIFVSTWLCSDTLYFLTCTYKQTYGFWVMCPYFCFHFIEVLR